MPNLSRPTADATSYTHSELCQTLGSHYVIILYYNGEDLRIQFFITVIRA